MASTTKPPQGSTRRRPGGRTARKTAEIRDAVLALLVEGGPSACTVSAVAERADVERSTLYRRYGSRWAMMADAFAGQAATQLAVTATGDFRRDMSRHLTRIAKMMATDLGRAMIVAAATARLNRSPLAGQYWQARLAQLQPVIDAAAAKGEIRAGIDAEALFADSDGPLFCLLLVVGRLPTQVDVRRVVDHLWQRYRSGGETPS
jgi:AcrR family transcriptional regulator